MVISGVVVMGCKSRVKAKHRFFSCPWLWIDNKSSSVKLLNRVRVGDFIYYSLVIVAFGQLPICISSLISKSILSVYRLFILSITTYIPS